MQKHIQFLLYLLNCIVQLLVFIFMKEYEILNNAPASGSMLLIVYNLDLLIVFLNKVLNKIMTSVCCFVLFIVSHTWLLTYITIITILMHIMMILTKYNTGETFL